jgi:AraC-like DNA-binding protein
MYKPTPVREEWRIEKNRKIRDIHLLYVIEGSCTYILDSKEVQLKRDQLIIITNNYSHSASNKSGKPLHIFSLRFGLYSNLEQEFEDSYFKNSFALITDPLEKLLYEPILNRMYQHYLEQKPESVYAINTLIHQLLLNICEEPKNIDLSGKIKRISEKIILHHGQGINVGSLAEEMKLSSKQFTQLFIKYNQTTPHQFIIKTRINHAKYLLEETQLPIGLVADELGYKDSFCFSKQFRNKVGLSPTDYRAKQKRG